ncbi:MAG: hypothetical protein JXC32_04150 [Anaerolineae bacterium]|nr:hypothetical protein [Anaerolineae bacterium]
MSRWISRNLSLLVVSLVLAFFLWAVALEAEDPTRLDTYGSTIPVELRDLPEDMTTYGTDNPRVRVDILAPQSVWSNLTADDISAYIDLTDVATGTLTLPIQVSVRLEPAEVRAIAPETLDLVVERIAEKEVPVFLRVQGAPAMGFRSEPAELAPQTLRIRGPESKVEQVTKAMISVSVEDRQRSLRGDYEPQLVDQAENPVEQVEAIPKSVTVNVPIAQLGFIRDIPITLGPLPGQPAPGYRVANLEYEPQVVKVFGRTEVVESVNFLRTEPISLEGITQTLSTRVNLQMPEGISIIEPPDPQVTVTLTVEVIRSGRTLEITPTIVGLASGLSASVGPDAVLAIVSGPLAVMESLEPQDIEIRLDLTGLDQGEYAITPQVIAPDDVDIENIIPDAVPVQIESPDDTANPFW